MHLHLVQFQVVSRQSFDVVKCMANGFNLAPTLLGSPKPPPATEAGWEDTIQVNPGRSSRSSRGSTTSGSTRSTVTSSSTRRTT
jgi:FtsP/CotA-like multicopper oxidase with cupredoxin domain